MHERKSKESLYVRMAPPGCRVNRDEGRELSPLLLRMVKKMKQKVAMASPRSWRRPHSHCPHPPPTAPPPNYKCPLPRVRVTQLRPHPPAMTPPEVWRPMPNFRCRVRAVVTSWDAGLSHAQYLRTVFACVLVSLPWQWLQRGNRNCWHLFSCYHWLVY